MCSAQDRHTPQPAPNTAVFAPKENFWNSPPSQTRSEEHWSLNFQLSLSQQDVHELTDLRLHPLCTLRSPLLPPYFQI